MCPRSHADKQQAREENPGNLAPELLLLSTIADYLPFVDE